MLTKPNNIRIFISSPGDVAEERALTRKVIERMKGKFSNQINIESIYWEHEPLRATQTFQEQIVRPSETDIVITILWSRLGTRLPAQFTRPDGSRYESGTEYEFEDAFQAYKEHGTPDLLIYLKTADPKVSLKDKNAVLERLKQKEALDNFFERWFLDKQDGSLIAAFHPFTNSAEYEEIIESHLSKLFNTRLPIITKGHALTTIKPVWNEGSPFRGLNVFKFEHSPVFFGRTKAVSEIIEALRFQAASDKAFILILGMSGGGKSSLIRAGVLPMITQPGVIEGVGLWRRAIMKPGDSHGDLFDGLAACLLQEHALPELGADKSSFKELARILRETPKAAVPLIKGGLSQAASEVTRNENLKEQPIAKLVLMIDQLEEMFSLKIISHEKREKFIEAIDALSRSGRVWVIATIRNDFYPRTTELDELVALKEGMGQYDLISPSPAEIGQMIRQPAQAAGLHFEEDPTTNERLDDVLRDATAKNPGALPLLEFTLEELYKQRTENNMLTFEAYHNLGGVEGALARRAEEVFARLDQRVQQVMDVELHFLVSIGADDEERISRKYASLKTITATTETKKFVDAFVEARLFTTDLTTDGKAVVYIAHEALLRHWPRLQDWVKKNREELRARTRLSAAALRWENEKRSGEFLYAAGKQVNEAEELLKNKKIELTDTEQSFIRASVSKRKRTWWIKRSITVVLLILTIVASGAAYLAIQERNKAKTKAKTAEQVSEFLIGIFKVADPSETLGDTITARQILDKGAKKIENELADQPEVQATLMNTIGNVYCEMGFYDQALSLLEGSLSIRRQIYDDWHPIVASSKNDLGRVYLEKGNYSKAEEFIREALGIRKKIYGDEHPDVAISLNDLGDVQEYIGNDSLAEIFYKESLEIRRKIYGEDHPEVAVSLTNLGLLAYYKGDYSTAEDLYMEALSINQNIYGDFHPTIADLLNNLASMYNALGNHEKAADFNSKALDISKKIYGEFHPDVAGSLNNLGYTYSRQGNYQKAAELYEQALKLRRKIYGNQHILVANSLSNLASVYYRQSKYPNAEMMFMEAIDILRNAHGDEHLNVAITINNLANVYKEKGDYAKAEELIREALEILQKLYGNEHPLVAYFQNSLGYFQCEKGNFSEAEEIYKSALATQQKLLPENHIYIAETKRNYGKCLIELNRFQEAETLLLESYNSMVLKFGEDDDRTKQTQEDIIDLYQAWEKPEKVVKYKTLMPDTKKLE